MRKILFSLLAVIALNADASELFYYSAQDGRGGLRFAAEVAGEWVNIGAEPFLSSDFGAWGSGKRMFTPQLGFDNGVWTCAFRVLPDEDIVATAKSTDLIHWTPQAYRNCAMFPPKADTLTVCDRRTAGYIIDVPESVLASLQDYARRRTQLKELYAETCSDDSVRFADMQVVNVGLRATGFSKKISSMLTGIFFEDINYAADGGLYGELVQNRDFEYDTSECGTPGWGPGYAWTTGGKTDFEILTADPVHSNNPHYARFSGYLENNGYDGIPLRGGENYIFTVKARAQQPCTLTVSINAERPEASGAIDLDANQWRDYRLVLTPHTDIASASLSLETSGSVDVDMVSLFPEKTFKDRPNGLRADLAQTLADLNPRFVRFPGGCVAHGNGIDNMYDWKGSVGPLEARRPLANLWGYHQTRGLGYYEFFQFCEDIGAEPLPVVGAGVPCQNSSRPSRFTKDALTAHGQQCGIPMDSLDSYIRDVLDLIEYANGPADSRWGNVRAAAGHPEPFNLKYLGIGNEDLISEVFEERFRAICQAVRTAHPEITVIGTVGPFYEGSDYDRGWELAREMKLDMVDEHYYVEPGWMIYNQHYYDNYPRNATKVYLGEWAAHLPGRPSNIETALAEALYLTALERNADVVTMSSYAPLLAKKGHTQWRPDLIYFNNGSITLTPDYEVMRLYGQYGGSEYLPAILHVDTDNPKAAARVASSIVRDDSGRTVIKLVNMLPAEANVDVDLREILTEVPEAAEIVTLAGRPADTDYATVSEAAVIESPQFKIQLKPYSFTIIRL